MMPRGRSDEEMGGNEIVTRIRDDEDDLDDDDDDWMSEIERLSRRCVGESELGCEN